MIRRKRIVVLVITFILFGALMGIRQDLPALWMRMVDAVIAFYIQWIGICMAKKIGRERVDE